METPPSEKDQFHPYLLALEQANQSSAQLDQILSKVNILLNESQHGGRGEPEAMIDLISSFRQQALLILDNLTAACRIGSAENQIISKSDMPIANHIAKTSSEIYKNLWEKIQELRQTIGRQFPNVMRNEKQKLSPEDKKGKVVIIYRDRFLQK